jgi:hypothetical protein
VSPIVVIILAILFLGVAWVLIHNTPRTLSMVLPPWFSMIFGGVLFIFFGFLAFCASYVLRDPILMMLFLMKMSIGIWFMMASTSSMRGSEEDKRFIRRFFVMLALLVFTFVGSIYVRDYRAMAMLNLLLVTGGFWVTTNYLTLIDPGRRR